MPPDVRSALEDAGLMEAYQLRPPYQRNDYLGWIAQAKRQATRDQRTAQMVAELADRTVYMKMTWRSGGGAG